jgi:hypothetical protein
MLCRLVRLKLERNVDGVVLTKYWALLIVVRLLEQE